MNLIKRIFSIFSKKKEQDIGVECVPFRDHRLEDFLIQQKIARERVMQEESIRCIELASRGDIGYSSLGVTIMQAQCTDERMIEFNIRQTCAPRNNE